MEEEKSTDASKESVITYELLEKNPNRYMRGKGHANFMIIEDGVNIGPLWMTNDDIRKNAENNPSQKGILFTGLM